jgi:fatty-acid desaturase
VFIAGPFLALLAAVPLTWGWGLGWLDIVLAAVFYTVTCLGVTVGPDHALGRRSHVAWSVNSICHLVCSRPYAARDRSANFWPLAILSMGESWHNLHHADPTCARQGVRRGQIDISARLIWLLEKAGWAHDVRWPTAKRLTSLESRC